jgi:hypothetical protein
MLLVDIGLSALFALLGVTGLRNVMHDELGARSGLAVLLVSLVMRALVDFAIWSGTKSPKRGALAIAGLTICLLGGVCVGMKIDLAASLNFSAWLIMGTYAAGGLVCATYLAERRRRVYLSSGSLKSFQRLRSLARALDARDIDTVSTNLALSDRAYRREARYQIRCSGLVLIWREAFSSLGWIETAAVTAARSDTIPIFVDRAPGAAAGFMLAAESQKEDSARIAAEIDRRIPSGLSKRAARARLIVAWLAATALFLLPAMRMWTVPSTPDPSVVTVSVALSDASTNVPGVFLDALNSRLAQTIGTARWYLVPSGVAGRPSAFRIFPSASASVHNDSLTVSIRAMVATLPQNDIAGIVNSEATVQGAPSDTRWLEAADAVVQTIVPDLHNLIDGYIRKAQETGGFQRPAKQ